MVPQGNAPTSTIDGAGRAAAGRPADDQTRVELLYVRDHAQRWIRFGRITSETPIDRRRKVVTFAPGSVFALVRWSSNDYGTVVSRMYVLRAIHAGEPFTTVPDVDPGGELLLRVSGWPKVKRALEAVDAVEAQGIAPEHVCPDHWRQLSGRLAAGHALEPYSRERHRAWLRRARLGL